MDLVHGFQADRPKTTVMLRNIPNHYSQAGVLTFFIMLCLICLIIFDHFGIFLLISGGFWHVFHVLPMVFLHILAILDRVC